MTSSSNSINGSPQPALAFSDVVGDDGQTNAEKAQWAYDENTLKQALTALGLPSTPESIALARLGAQNMYKRIEQDFNKSVAKELATAEKKKESPDLEALAQKSMDAVCSTERSLERIELLGGNCSKCSTTSYALAQQHKTLQKCARCREAIYCSKECQKAHWPTHKSVCKAPSNAQPAPAKKA